VGDISVFGEMVDERLLAMIAASLGRPYTPLRISVYPADSLFVSNSAIDEEEEEPDEK
jgi:hypothetical protein